MKLVPELQEFEAELTVWRRDFHAHPELGFEEFRTAGIVAEKLTEFGLEVDQGLAGTGVVGILSNGSSDRKIGLRADLDALAMPEANTFDHKSRNDGKMHGCGHDGHTTMLLGAAWYLSKTRGFDGTVYFIFQPAEEAANGGLRMIEDGLFEKFPASEVYGMHNIPGIPTGTFSTCPGALMASMDVFDVTIRGIGGHGGMPHRANSPVLAACKIISALHEFATHQIDPNQRITLSVCDLHAGDAINVIPDEIRFRGTVRSLDEEARQLMEEAFPRISKGISDAYGVECDVDYKTNYPLLINSHAETAKAVKVAEELVGAENVDGEVTPFTGSEDFAWMLQRKPGNYIFIGNGEGSEGGCMVHNPNYDFNDRILPLGASYWVRLAETLLNVKS
jgi:hippurate hydrolase